MQIHHPANLDDVGLWRIWQFHRDLEHVGAPPARHRRPGLVLAGAAVHTTHPTLWPQVGLQDKIDKQPSDSAGRVGRAW